MQQLEKNLKSQKRLSTQRNNQKQVYSRVGLLVKNLNFKFRGINDKKISPVITNILKEKIQQIYYLMNQGNGERQPDKNFWPRFQVFIATKLFIEKLQAKNQAMPRKLEQYFLNIGQRFYVPICLLNYIYMKLQDLIQLHWEKDLNEEPYSQFAYSDIILINKFEKNNFSYLINEDQAEDYILISFDKLKKIYCLWEHFQKLQIVEINDQIVGLNQWLQKLKSEPPDYPIKKPFEKHHLKLCIEFDLFYFYQTAMKILIESKETNEFNIQNSQHYDYFSKFIAKIEKKLPYKLIFFDDQMDEKFQNNDFLKAIENEEGNIQEGQQKQEMEVENNLNDLYIKAAPLNPIEDDQDYGLMSVESDSNFDALNTSEAFSIQQESNTNKQVMTELTFEDYLNLNENHAEDYMEEENEGWFDY